MNKKDVLEAIFYLKQDEILDICEILNGYKERLHKTKKDTLLMRQLFVAGYHNTREFYKKNNIGKDHNLASALNYETTNIRAYLKLKEIFNINSVIFNDILIELAKVKE